MSTISKEAETVDRTEQCYRSLYCKPVVWIGQSGCGKTNAAHYWMWSWIREARYRGESPPILYGYDRHYGVGRNRGYESLWLGLPMTHEVPQAVNPCVFKDPGGNLASWLKPVVRLYLDRMAGPSNCADYRPVICFIDEATMEVPALNSVEREEFLRDLKLLFSCGSKYNIFPSLIIHSIHKNATGIDLGVYRQAVLATNPSSFGAGFLTSDETLLPPPPLSNIGMQLEWEEN